jgi:hypothetical protein
LAAYLRELGNNKDYYDALIDEYQDNFVQSILFLNWFKIAQHVYQKSIEVGKAVISAAKEVTKEEAAYYFGYVISQFIETTFLPLKLARLAKLQKLEEVILKIEKILNKVTEGVAQAGKNILETFLKLIDNFIQLLQKGTDDAIKFFDEFLDEIEKIGDDIAKKIKEVAGLSKEDLDWMANQKTGSLGGNILKATQIRKLRGILKQKGIILIVEDDVKSITRLFKEVDGFKSADELFSFMRSEDPPFVGAFNPNTKQFFLSKNCTELVAFHEQAHLKQFLELGEGVYKTYDKLQKETYVWEQILANKNRWTKAELQDALWYINKVRKEFNLEPLKIKI